MGNRNKKIVQIGGRTKAGMMDQAVKDICDVSEEVTNQLEMKRGMMQTVLDIAQEGFERTGVSVRLRLAEDGYDFLFSDLQDYVNSPDDDEDDEEGGALPFDLSGLFDEDDEDDWDDMDDMDIPDLPIEMFGGVDEAGNEYSVLVMLTEKEDEEDAFDMSVAIIRSSEDGEQILTPDGWEETPDLF